jgi:hypothetical protein
MANSTLGEYGESGQRTALRKREGRVLTYGLEAWPKCFRKELEAL